MMKTSTDPPAFRVRPAQPEEAGAFFAQTSEQDAQMGAIGHVRMDFGGSGKEFWHTWHPRGSEDLNTPEFKAELQQVVDKLRETVLKDLSSMRRFCHENGGKISGGWTQNYGYVVETERYEYCLRCNPVQGDYQAYLSCFDLDEQKINHAYLDVFLDWYEDGQHKTEHFMTGKTLGESGADLDRMSLISSAITKAVRGDNIVHARYMVVGAQPEPEETMSLNLSPDEQRLVAQALAEQRIRLGPQAEGEEKLLRRMTGSVTEYMDAAGLADRLTESDRALLAQHDGEPETTPVMGGMQL